MVRKPKPLLVATLPLMARRSDEFPPPFDGGSAPATVAVGRGVAVGLAVGVAVGPGAAVGLTVGFTVGVGETTGADTGAGGATTWSAIGSGGNGAAGAKPPVKAKKSMRRVLESAFRFRDGGLKLSPAKTGRML